MKENDQFIWRIPSLTSRSSPGLSHRRHRGRGDQHGILTKLSEGIRFTRKRFGRYDVIDFLAVLFGYAISGERTLEEFYERPQPFAVPNVRVV